MSGAGRGVTPGAEPDAGQGASAASPEPERGRPSSVDNGAEAMVTAKNSALYLDQGIRAAVSALRPGGVLAYWSAVADPPFVKRLEGAGLTVTTQRSRAHGSTGPYHEIIIARV